jgi:hypothetical protein
MELGQHGLCQRQHLKRGPGVLEELDVFYSAKGVALRFNCHGSASSITITDRLRTNPR